MENCMVCVYRGMTFSSHLCESCEEKVRGIASNDPKIVKQIPVKIAIVFRNEWTEKKQLGDEVERKYRDIRDEFPILHSFQPEHFDGDGSISNCDNALLNYYTPLVAKESEPGFSSYCYIRSAELFYDLRDLLR